MVLGQVHPVCSTNPRSHADACMYLNVKPQCHPPDSGIWRFVFLNETELLFFSFKRQTPFSFSQSSSSRTSSVCSLPGSKMTSTQCSIFSLLVFIFITDLRLKTLFVKEAPFYSFNFHICCYSRLSPSRMGAMPCCHRVSVTPPSSQCPAQRGTLTCMYWICGQWLWMRWANLSLALSEFASLWWALHYSFMVSSYRGGFIRKVSEEMGGLGLRCLWLGKDLPQAYMRKFATSARKPN